MWVFDEYNLWLKEFSWNPKSLFAYFAKRSKFVGLWFINLDLSFSKKIVLFEYMGQINEISSYYDFMVGN